MVTPEQGNLIDEFHRVFPTAHTVEDTMRLCLRLRAELQSTEESDDYEQEPSDYYERQISDDARRD